MATVSELRTQHAGLVERRARIEGQAETTQREYDTALRQLHDDHGCDSIAELDVKIADEQAALTQELAEAETAMTAAEAGLRGD